MFESLRYNRAKFYTAAAVDCLMDIIFIEDLRAETWIGIYPREKAMPQTVEISLHIGVSTASAGASDDIGDTVHYGELCEAIRSSLKNQNFLLIEMLAEHVANLVLQDFNTLWVRVKIVKPGILDGVKEVGVEIERSKE